MKIWLSPYLLKSIRGEERPGFLLRVQNEAGAFGYADLFPWPEFGDPKFEDIPSCLKEKKPSALIQRSLKMAEEDALARQESRSLFSDEALDNHALILGKIETWLEQIHEKKEQGFNKFKLKLRGDTTSELKFLKKVQNLALHERSLRFDFNSQGQKQSMFAIKDMEPLVEFVEDPFSDPKQWTPDFLPWAFDHPRFSAEQTQYDFRIVKPAKMVTPEQEKCSLIFTSYLDHPVGIAHAFVQAQRYGEQTNTYGLMSQQVYQSTAFHEYLVVDGSFLNLSSEEGIGFTDLLQSQNWELLQ